MLSALPKIVRIEGFEIGCRLSEPIGNARLMFDSRASLLVAVTAESGEVGWGETWALPDAAGAMVRQSLGPMLIGRDATAPWPAWQAMRATLGYDRRGVSTMAMSALDIALWDLAGRIAGKPVHALLGGRLRATIPAYVSGPFMKPGRDPYRDYARDVAAYLEAGFRAIKMRMGTEPHADGRLAAAVRRQIGDDIALMVDLNEGFSVRGALDIARRLDEADLVFLEEPIAHDDLPGYRRLSAALPMGLAGGEALLGLKPFRDFLAEGVLDVAQPDLALCGGLSEGMRIAALADAFDVPVVPHVWGGIVNFHASLHFAACLPEKRGRLRMPLFEYDPSENPLRTRFGTHPLDADGRIAVPDGPGLGLDLSPERLAPLLQRSWSIE